MAENPSATQTVIHPESGPQLVGAGTYLATFRKTLIDMGVGDPDAMIRAGGEFVGKCQAAGVDPAVAAVAMYTGERHRHEVARTTIHEASEVSTREEWEVVVRRQGAMADLYEAAGRKPDEIIGHNVTFGDFYDDEKARAFARKMTAKGYIAMYGPRKMMAAETAEEKAALRWTEIWWHHPADAAKFARLLEKKHSTVVALAVNRIVRTNASRGHIEAVLTKHRWQGEYTYDEPGRKAAEEGDPSAMACEVAPVIHEAGSIPWRKVERDAKAHEADMKLAERYGAISTPQKVYEVVGAELTAETQETFILLPLNLRGELVTRPYLIAKGQKSRVSVGVEDVLRAALDSGCEGYLVCHQHPSGKATPSKADRELTKAIADATKPYGSGMKFLDHCVVGHRCIYSIVEDKLYRIKG